MIDVTDRWWLALIFAGVSGAVGGLISDLLLVRLEDAGLLERPSLQRADEKNRSYFDVGFVGSVLVGAVAAIGFLYFLTPDVTTTVTENGEEPLVTRQYDAISLVAATALVGTAGAAFLQTMQDRLRTAKLLGGTQQLAQTMTDQARELAKLTQDIHDDQSIQVDPAVTAELSTRVNLLATQAARLC